MEPEFMPASEYFTQRGEGQEEQEEQEDGFILGGLVRSDPPYVVSTEVSFSASHCLRLPYHSPCERQHGHNYRASITLGATELSKAGMVVDFSAVKAEVRGRFDHLDLNLAAEDFKDNDTLASNPTAENLAGWIAVLLTEAIPSWVGDGMASPSVFVMRVEVEETPGNQAVFTPEHPWE